MASSGYTDDEKTNIKRMYLDEGLSASQIARAVGGGRTRNSIIGLAHRQGWRKSPQAMAQNRQRHYRRHALPMETSEAIVRVRSIRRPELLEQAATFEMFGPEGDFPALGCCRYTHYDPQIRIQFCGYPTGERDLPTNQEGDITLSWCTVHNVIAHQAAGASVTGGVAHDPEADYVRGPRRGRAPGADMVAKFEAASDTQVLLAS